MAIVIVLILLVVGSVLFYFLSPWHLTPLASNWGAIDNTILITFWVTGIVFVLVMAFTVWCVVRYRYDPERRASYEPENKKLEIWLTIITTIGIAALLAPGLKVWNDFVGVPDDAHKVAVVGSQWHWQFRYPGADGELGRTHARFVSADNPLGIDPDDPHGQDDIIVDKPVLYLPVDQPVQLVLTSRDVIHNFMVPNFRAKMDALPGQMSYFWFTPTEVGEYVAVCAQHCGVAHFAMRSRVNIVEQEEFEQWLAEQPTFAETQAREPDIEAGEAQYAVCTACHGDQGQGNPDMNSPRLAGLESWYIERQLANFVSGARGEHPDDQFGPQMRPFATMLDEQGMRNVAAYIGTMPVEVADATVSGNVNRGQRLYRTCANCHGREGEGRWALNAPRLAGIDDWYLVTQLENFREGVRGRHPEDLYGDQMIDMTQYLVDERAIHDVVAYINTLSGEAPASANSRIARAED
jgi:cytochrome c oxidase subunit II